MEVPNQWRKYPCADYFREGWSERGHFDEPSQTLVIAPLSEIHPDGRFAVLSCLDDTPRAAVHQANSHLAVVDLTSKPARLLYHLPVESLPEGIEFAPGGAHLFVQLTYARRIAVFEVDGSCSSAALSSSAWATDQVRWRWDRAL